MKNTHTSIMKTSVMIFIILLGTSLNVWANKNDTDDKNYYEINGKIIDESNKKELVFATITVEGENTATISNIEGEFLLKIGKLSKAQNIRISFLGYNDLVYPINKFGNKMHVIKLMPKLITLDEIVVTPNTADQLVRLALDKVSENYESEAFQMTGFFREFVKKRRTYVSLAEAVLEIYKAPYDHEFSIDQAKILKGRKGTDKRRLDTLLFKVQGGPATILLLDVAKNPEILFSEENWNNYNFTMEPQVTIYDRTNFVVKFEQIYRSMNPMYNGKLYIDVESLAITGVEFELNVFDAAEAGRLFLRKKPAGLKLLLEKAVYKVMYKEQNGKWYFNYANGFTNYNLKWKKKLFSTKYTTMFEIAITDRQDQNVERIRSKERFKASDNFVEKVSDFYDPDFWGAYNTIKPDDPIETAIKRLKRSNR